jgi:agmatine deiminase
MPAEWEPHAATWLSWPHNASSWPGKLDAAVAVFARMVAALSRSETVHINVNDLEMEREARRGLQRAGAGGEIIFHHFPTNDAWCRDHGAVFVVRDAGGGEPGMAAVDWGYNAWGEKYPPFDLDNAIARQMAEQLGVPRFDGGMILEGGSIDVNGQGLLLTTQSCLLNPNRNPHLTRNDIEQRLMDFLGVERVLWLGDGIVGDDTDGHIDDLTRFVAPNVVVTVVERDASDENYLALADNLARLRQMTNLDGRPLEVVELPMPPALFWQGQRLPASYANFYIANDIVLLPAFSTASDEQAAAVLKELFPTRDIVTLDCADLVWGLGAFHCLTQQVPACSIAGQGTFDQYEKC